MVDEIYFLCKRIDNNLFHKFWNEFLCIIFFQFQIYEIFLLYI